LDHPQNFALVEEQTVVFAPGLNIITGQSGAGKSVLVRRPGAPE
jgi:DNA repair protein RecN (Recombination protein N)